jgi:hypothetical protein
MLASPRTHLRRCAAVAMAIGALTSVGISALAAEPAVKQDAPKQDAPKQDAPKQDAPKQDDPAAALKKLLTEHPELAAQLRALLDQLDKDKGAGTPTAKPGDEPPIPDVTIPGTKSPVSQPNQPVTAGQTPSSASRTPDISVIGNHVGRFLSVSGDPDRNRLQLNELEIGLQQPIYPGIRFDAFLAAGAEEDFTANLEEGYVTFSRVGHLPFGGLLGKKRLNFGKVNPVHPHSRLFADQPAALAYLVDPEALNGNGASLNYLLPFKNLFANLEVGLWNLNPSEEGEEIGDAPNTTFNPLGVGVMGNVVNSRLWLSKELRGKSELELGASHGFGRNDLGDNISLTGLDLTYRNFPGTFKRMILQGEVFWNKRNDRSGGTGSHTRSGHYVLLGFRPDQYIDYGLRYDNTRLPWPLNGREQSFSLIWTNRMTETTLFRLQFKHGDRISDVLLPSRRGFNEIYAQFIWGGGSHTHSIQ